MAIFEAQSCSAWLYDSRIDATSSCFDPCKVVAVLAEQLGSDFHLADSVL